MFLNNILPASAEPACVCALFVHVCMSGLDQVLAFAPPELCLRVGLAVDRVPTVMTGFPPPPSQVPHGRKTPYLFSVHYFCFWRFVFHDEYRVQLFSLWFEEGFYGFSLSVSLSLSLSVSPHG